MLLGFAVLLGACGARDGSEPPPEDPPRQQPQPDAFVLADGIDFLPEWFLSTRQLRPSLVSGGDDLFFTDSTEAPLKKLSLVNGTVTPLALRMGTPTRIAMDGQRVYWTERDRLLETALDTGETRVVATGNAETTATLLVDAEGPIWVRTVETLECSPPCLRRIERMGSTAYAGDAVSDGANLYLAFRAFGPDSSSVLKVPLDGAPVEWITKPGFTRPQDCVMRVAVDTEAVYWTSGGFGQTPGACAINKAPLGGGPAVTLVEAPIVDFALDGDQLWFSTARLTVIDGSGKTFVGDDAINRMSSSGGEVTTWPVSGFPSIVAVDAVNVYWLGLEGTVGWFSKTGAHWGAIAVGDLDESQLYVDALMADGGRAYWTNTRLGMIAALEFP